jgi:hypothetical protein
MKLKSAIWAVLLVLGASGMMLHADNVTATVEKVNGNVYATNSAGKSKKLQAGDTVSVGSLIHTNADSSLRLKLVPGAMTVLTPGTDVVISTLSYSQAGGVKMRDIKLTLHSGEILCSLAKHDGHSEFRVVTPDGTTKAIGTDWMVSFTAAAGVTVATVDGVVQITLPNGKVVSVPGGQVTTSADGVTTVTGHLTKQELAEIDSALKGENGGVTNTFTITPITNPANNSLNPTISPTE